MSVYSHFDVIKHMLSKPILHSRIGKWYLTLTEYSLTYAPLKAVKGHIVVDFIADNVIVKQTQTFVEVKPWRLYFDGSRYKNGIKIGILIISTIGIPTKFKFKIQG